MKNKMEKIKESFSFLTEQEYFVCTYEDENCIEFFYDTKDILCDDLQYEGAISITSSYLVEWRLVEECNEYEKTYKSIHVTPDWFCMLYEQVMVKATEKTRLRHLFDPPKTQKVTVDQLFDELSKRLNKK